MNSSPGLGAPPARVLIVDDIRLDRQLLEVMLAPEGYVLQTAVSGEEALAMVARQRPDLILLDIRMRDLDGCQVTATIKGNLATKNIPVIMVTAMDDRDARMLGLNAGAEDFLTKPVDRAELCVRVRNLLRLKAYGDYHDQYSEMLEGEVLSRTADLVERTKALEQQTAVLAEQAALLDLAQDAIIVLDMQNRIVFWNCGAEAMYGWTSQEALGRNNEALLNTEFSDPDPAEHIEGTLLRQGRWEGEAIHHTRDGTRVNVASRWTLQRGANGAPIRILTINNDITDRKQADSERLGLVDDLQSHASALRENEQRTKFALGAAHMGVWEIDVATERVTWSETMAPMFGLTPDQAPTTREGFFALIHPDDRRVVEDAVTTAARDGTDFEAEFRVVWPDGSMRWNAGRARMLRDADDRPVRLLGVSTDISDRKLLEAQLRQAQKMDAVGQLAGGVAHDFNNLLTAILGYSNFVIDTFESSDPRRSDMEQVIKAGERATALTKQLLAFSRKQILQPTIVDLNALVTGMGRMLSRLIGEQVDLVPILAAGLCTVRADSGQLEQVLMNLVVNARDAMPSGGRLAIETANVELDESFIHDVVIHPGPYAMLAVSDSGIGMDEATKQRLFEPFFTTKEQGKGTGLGLATVYGIVKQSGGYVWVFSEPGKGATFKVYLPCAERADVIARSIVREEDVAAGTETVLVVEDEAAVRFLTRRILEKAGYRVFEAPDPGKAEALFEQDPNLFALLVTDVIMPGSSGPQLFERLSRQRPDLKVLYVSGYTDDTIVRQGQLDPSVEFLQKPFTAHALRRRVREVLDR
jgi:two-component system cell cycle sensor histidine kinase/response regulator CckA